MPQPFDAKTPDPGLPDPETPKHDRGPTALAALVQNRNLNAYALILFGAVAFGLKMPESIYGGLILGGLAVLRTGA